MRDVEARERDDDVDEDDDDDDDAKGARGGGPRANVEVNAKTRARAKDDDDVDVEKVFRNYQPINEGANCEPVASDEKEFARLLRGFHDGDAEAILRECRGEDNAPYDEETIASMMAGLREHGKTIHAPFCFTRGAIAIKRKMCMNEWMFALRVELEQRMKNKEITAEELWAPRQRYAECEIGVYISRAGGDIAEWHSDTNDNLTLQLTGSKIWEVEDLELEDLERDSWVARTQPLTLRNSSLADEPRCGMDYLTHTRSTFVPFAHNAASLTSHSLKPKARTNGATRYRLDAGHTLCTKAGQYHRVTPVGATLCVSIDVRLTPFQDAVWNAEIYFLCMRQSWVDRAPKSLENFRAELRERGRPRFMPFQPEFSDGLVLGATLDYIAGLTFDARGELYHKRNDQYIYMHDIYTFQEPDPKYRALYFNPMCACSVSTSGAYHIVNIRSTSSLTNKDYMSEFNIYIRRYSQEDELNNNTYDLHEWFENPSKFNSREAERVRISKSDKRLYIPPDVLKLRFVLHRASVLVPCMGVPEDCLGLEFFESLPRNPNENAREAPLIVHHGRKYTSRDDDGPGFPI